MRGELTLSGGWAFEASGKPARRAADQGAEQAPQTRDLLSPVAPGSVKIGN